MKRFFLFLFIIVVFLFLSGSTRSQTPLVWAGYIEQSGDTDIPLVLAEYKDDFGVTFTGTRDSMGVYYLTADKNVFPIGKTFIISEEQGPVYRILAIHSDTNQILIMDYEADGATPFEGFEIQLQITVYP